MTALMFFTSLWFWVPFTAGMLGLKFVSVRESRQNDQNYRQDYFWNDQKS